MLLIVLVCSLSVAAMSQQVEDDWIDPYDMLNYDQSTKTMRKPAEVGWCSMAFVLFLLTLLSPWLPWGHVEVSAVTVNVYVCVRSQQTITMCQPKEESILRTPASRHRVTRRWSLYRSRSVVKGFMNPLFSFFFFLSVESNHRNAVYVELYHSFLGGSCHTELTVMSVYRQLFFYVSHFPADIYNFI